MSRSLARTWSTQGAIVARTCAEILLTGAPFLLDWFLLGKHYSLKYGYALLVRHHLDVLLDLSRKWSISLLLSSRHHNKQENVQHGTRATTSTNIGVSEWSQYMGLHICSINHRRRIFVCAWNSLETMHLRLLHVPPSNKPAISFIRQTVEILWHRAAFPFAQLRPSSAEARLPMTSRTLKQLHSFS